MAYTNVQKINEKINNNNKNDKKKVIAKKLNRES